MVIDFLSNYSIYYKDNEKFSKVVEFCREHDLKTLPLGRYDIDEKNYVNIVEYNVGNSDVFEMHRKYCDVQLIISGNENILCTNQKNITTTKEYDEKIDAKLGTANEFITLNMQENMFVALYPDDAHCPNVKNSSEKVKKAIFKISLE